MTTLGDPTNNAQGVVHYLTTSANTRLPSYIDAIAVDSSDHVVAVLSARHFWYPAQFVAQVAEVVATGHGCHADLGIKGTTEQGGGVRITKIVRYSAAAHALSDTGVHARRTDLRQKHGGAPRERDAGVSL
jgi:hypothetical protein